MAPSRGYAKPYTTLLAFNDVEPASCGRIRKLYGAFRLDACVELNILSTRVSRIGRVLRIASKVEPCNFHIRPSVNATEPARRACKHP